MSGEPGQQGAPVTIVIVSYNTRELLRRCLRSLEADVAEGLADVIVVDNCSGDGSAEMAEGEFGWARVVRPGSNVGFGRGVNAGATLTAAPWLVAANADTEVEAGALRRLVAAAGADPRAGAVAPRLVEPSGRTQHSVHGFPGVGLALVFGLGLGRLFPGFGDRLCLEGQWDPERPRIVDWAHGAFLLLRREAFEQIGGFDPAQWMYAEDIDLAWRLRRAGWVVAYEPHARIRHEVSAATSAAFGDQRLDLHTTATYGWLRRRRGVAYTFAFLVTNLVVVGTRMIVYSALSVLGGARWRRYRAVMRRYLSVHRNAWARSRGSA